MLHLAINPHLLVCPNYALPNFKAVRQLNYFSDEEPAATIQYLDHAAWNAQVTADTEAAADAKHNHLKQLAANQVEVEKELNKKWLKLLPLNDSGMPSIFPVHSPLYAFHKLELIKYGLALQAVSSVCTSCKVIPDADLSWDQFSSARTVYISKIQCTKWPTALTKQTASFLFALENHPMACITDYGKWCQGTIQDIRT
ncbi:hypothetical protein HETIRDRAFT_421383 [Heterobasidion irregulare TC 32-1]|uniref:Uncharacterized protein n=1 Tax=Heterobasidion irregulare (strain TC 32-1) TaxID=747525 RepID=W4JWG6_HETIT|nr:uncharacterized protein HETIRDRAFT_421383 [Heterobasidion irregulare TC 32-1]ETW77231.1 hypothetical protein HETIRDRAFT_421383 [Heterobasidion irregulare TC 32-1]